MKKTNSPQRSLSILKGIIPIIFSSFLMHVNIIAQDHSSMSLLSEEDLNFMENLTLAVFESSRIYPGQKISDEFGPNNTGGILIRPGGRDCYPAFWIRDYAMSLESGLVPPEEQKHMLFLTASTQCDQTWITKNGSMIPYGAIADHIRIDDTLPIFFPGTYSYEDQGSGVWGKVPPYSDQFFFIHMAWQYLKSLPDKNILLKEINGMALIDRLELAFKVAPSGKNHLVYTTSDFRGVDFGFRDVIEITGYLCYPSILKYRAANELAEMYTLLDKPNKALVYQNIASAIKKAIPEVFMDDSGMLRASTEKSQQRDVWSTALGVYLNVLDTELSQRACKILAQAYKDGTLAYKGNIRHIISTDDFDETTAWEYSLGEKNKYQNGAYWGTPTGWVCYAIALVDLKSARSLSKEYVDDLRDTDYRKGGEFGGPYECFHPETGNLQNPVYLTTVSCPYSVFKVLRLP
jgi:hypothetical protein